MELKVLSSRLENKAQADIIRTVKRVREKVSEIQVNIPDDINIFIQMTRQRQLKIDSILLLKMAILALH